MVAAIVFGATAPLAGLSAGHAAPGTAESTAAADWLADQLTDGVLHNDQYDFDDYALSIDVALALNALGAHPGSVSDVLDAVAADPTVYTRDFPGDTESQYAGQTGKLAVAVEDGGRDATAFGGHDLVAELEDVVEDDGDETGRGVDVSAYGEYSNTIGQTWIVRALSRSGSSERDAAVDYLLKQQCSDGSFRVNLFKEGSVARTCGAPDASDVTSVDATSLGVVALLEAKDAGASGLDDEVADAASWLLDDQASDGSFGDGGAQNTNSTGLAAVALHATGHDDAASEAADWIAALQVDEDTPKLGDQAGAVAFSADALAAGRTDGIVAETRDQWRRATTQAAPALDLLAAEGPAGPVASMSLTASDLTAKLGDTIRITAQAKDADGRQVGDVTEGVTLTSSVDTDTIDGTSVTFNHASPHVLTATHTATRTTASITIEVSPAADGPTDEPDDGDDGDSDDGSTSSAGSDQALPDAGSPADRLDVVLAAGLVAGGTLLIAGTRRRPYAAHTWSRGHDDVAAPGAVSVLGAAAGLVAFTGPAEAKACPAGTGVTVVVNSSVGCDKNGGGTAASNFADAGHTLRYAAKEPGFVCRVNGSPSSDPCGKASPANAYWGLFWSDGKSGKWVYASSGVGSVRVPKGGWVAFVFQSSNTRKPPGMRPVTAASQQRTASTSSGSIERDLVQRRPVPGVVPDAPADANAVQEPLVRRIEPDGTKTSAAPSPSASASASAEAHDVSTDVEQAGQETSVGTAVPWWAAVGLAVLLAGAAAYAFLRRRSTRTG